MYLVALSKVDLQLILLYFLGGIFSLGSSSEDHWVAGLKKHNAYRAAHNTPLLELDCELVEVAEKCAQYYANKGTIDHTCPDRIKINAGENLSWGSGFKFTPSEAVAFATERWYKESQYYDYNTGQQLEGTRNEFRHFTQVMWKDSKKLGMGYAKKQNGFYVVGLYLPPGNYEGRFKENVNPPSPGGAVLPLQGSDSSDSSKCSPSTQSSSSVIRGQMGSGAGGTCLALVMSAVLTNV